MKTQGRDAVHAHPDELVLDRPAKRWQIQLVPVIISLVIAAVVAAVVAAIVASRGKTYEAQATLAINQTAAIQASADAGVIAKLSALRFKYAGLLTTAALDDPIASQLGLPPAAVRGHLTTKTLATNSLLMPVVADSPSRALAQRIAQGGADYLVSYVQQEQASAKVPPLQRFTFSVVTPAGAAAQTSPTHKLEAGAAGLAAVVAFGISVSVLTLLWRRH